MLLDHALLLGGVVYQIVSVAQFRHFYLLILSQRRIRHHFSVGQWKRTILHCYYLLRLGQHHTFQNYIVRP